MDVDAKAKKLPPLQNKISKIPSESSDYSDYFEEKPLKRRTRRVKNQDFELITSLATKLSKAEKELVKYKQECMAKTRIITRMQERMQKLKLSIKQGSDLDYIEHLEQKIDELEGRFTLQEDNFSSLVPSIPSFHFDIQKVKENVRDLNIIAGEGTSEVVSSNGQGKLATRDALQLAIYQNGIFFCDGPFRSFQESDAVQFVQDIQDGYFPSELRSRYPDGVPIELKDYSHARYALPELPFTGHGHSVGSTEQQCISDHEIPPNLRLKHLSINNDCEIEIKPQTQQSFIDKLPKCAIRNGNIIDVRSGIQELLGFEKRNPIVLDIPSTIPANPPEANRQQSPRRVSKIEVPMAHMKISIPTSNQELRIKLPSGMLFGELLQHISPFVDPIVKQPWELRTAFQPEPYSHEKTLAECGFVPNVKLHVKKLTV